MESWFIDNRGNLIFFLEEYVILQVGDYVNIGPLNNPELIEIKKVVFDPLGNCVSYHLNIIVNQDQLDAISIKIANRYN